MRLFIACPLELKLIKKLAELQEYLKKKSGNEKIRWVPPENIHLTLKFLGECSPALCSKIIGVLTEAAGGSGPYEGCADRGGVFPSLRRPRVLWVRFSDRDSHTGKLKRAIDKNLQKIGFEPDHRKFLPHLTIGRIKKPSKNSLAGEVLVNECEVKEKSLISSVNIYESILKPSGASYRVVESIEL